MAIFSTCAGVYHFAILDRLAPCVAAFAGSKRMSVPHAVRMPCFLASAYAASVPANISSCFFRLGDPSANADGPSSTNGCRLHQMPFSAMSFAVASSSNWPWSMHVTPASIACRTARGV